jgi:hypothetical protein
MSAPPAVEWIAGPAASFEAALLAGREVRAAAVAAGASLPLKDLSRFYPSTMQDAVAVVHTRVEDNKKKAAQSKQKSKSKSGAPHTPSDSHYPGAKAGGGEPSAFWMYIEVGAAALRLPLRPGWTAAGTTPCGPGHARVHPLCGAAGPPRPTSCVPPPGLLPRLHPRGPAGPAAPAAGPTGGPRAEGAALRAPPRGRARAAAQARGGQGGCRGGARRSAGGLHARRQRVGPRGRRPRAAAQRHGRQP